ncbi:MAG: TRAP transporter large permease, partial [Bacillota bacterium]
AGITGSAVADASAIGSILVPAMVEEKYEKKFAAALTAAASIVGPIIPPSIIAVIYSYCMGVSVAGLFVAGVIPGLMIGLGLMGYSYYISVKRGYPKHEFRATPAKVWDATRKAFLALLMPIIIVGGILSGVFTATEAAAVAVGYSLIIGFFVTKNFKVQDLAQLFISTAATSSMVFIVIGTSSILQWVVARENVGVLVGELFKSISSSPYHILFIINIIYLIAGMLIDTTPAILLFAPILAPIAVKAGVHPLHLGIITEVNLAIGLATPPVGVSLFVTSGITKTPLEDLMKAILPLLLIEIIVLFLITYVPSLTMFLPKLFGYA